MKFTEASLEKAFTELLGQEGFPHHLGITITRKSDEVLIEKDLQSFLLTQYAAQGITINEIEIIRSFRFIFMHSIDLIFS